MRKRFISKKLLNWLNEKFPKGKVTPEVRERIKVKFPGYHLAKNGSGRRKKEKPIEADYKLSDQISNEYRTSHLGKFPGKNLGD